MKQRFYFYFFETTVFKALNTGPWRSVVTEKGQVGPKQPHATILESVAVERGVLVGARGHWWPP